MMINAVDPPAGLLPALRGRRGSPPSLDLGGLSDFERDVLTATRRIPTGETRPYGRVAREAGRPRAVRAVGTVLARNPVPLLVPCHRVVRADGQVGDYMFGATHKEELLRGEGANLDDVAAHARQGVHYLGSDTTGVVCFPTCHHARRITTAHRHRFRTIGAALAGGYRPCRTCRPAHDDAARPTEQRTTRRHHHTHRRSRRRVGDRGPDMCLPDELAGVTGLVRELEPVVGRAPPRQGLDHAGPGVPAGPRERA